MDKKDQISTGLIIFLSIVAVLIFSVMVIGGWVWGSYNTFVVAKQDINTQWSNVKTEYQRRADLFYNMVEVTKGYGQFEKDTMTQVIQARTGKFDGTKQQQMQQLNELDSTIQKLMLVWEQYPNLKAIEQYNKLSEEMQRTENRIQIARTDYNTLVRSYNILVMTFPKNMLANTFGFKEEQFFENEYDTTSSPKVDMRLK